LQSDQNSVRPSVSGTAQGYIGAVTAATKQSNGSAGGAADEVIRYDDAILVFGGPCSNFEATAALLDVAARRGIAPDRIICTGDVVAYAADARATVELVRRAGIRVVMGNCEEALAEDAADCGCGFAPGSTCAELSSAWYGHARRELDAEQRGWMAGLPRRLVVEMAGRRLAVVHGAPSAINRFLFASCHAAVKEAELREAAVDGIIGGHCGLPFTQTVGGRLWHNAGAIGVPANDGTPRVWYSVLTPRSDAIEIEHCALDYDHATAAEKMRRAGLPEGYAAALSSGRWPSCDVLPAVEIRAAGQPLEASTVTWNGTIAPRGRRVAAEIEALWPGPAPIRRLDPAKFRDPDITAGGERRAEVALGALRTLWINTGTLCNVTCRNCYIESSPRNDRLAYITAAEVAAYLDEIEREKLATEEIGFTGGEPFMNPELFPMLEECLRRGYRALVLTNAMRPMQLVKAPLLDLLHRFGERLTLRVSLDHFTAERHEEERGPGAWAPTLAGLLWLARNGLRVAVAGRTQWGEAEAAERAGYQRLFAAHDIPIDAADPAQLVLFPEMDAREDVPEITERCWGILDKSPADVMCAASRMVVKRNGAAQPTVVACTLIPYEAAFDLGPTLAGALGAVKLNHPHCAKFCVLGGASCSR
jgi:predicted phosphodiesterase/uncharacterized Fe-S cluster-containing radical SAM superfamily protein